MLSFDFSDRQINVVKGDNTANRIKIDKSVTIDVPEDMILNGEVINLSGLNEIISAKLKEEMEGRLGCGIEVVEDSNLGCLCGKDLTC